MNERSIFIIHWVSIAIIFLGLSGMFCTVWTSFTPQDNPTQCWQDSTNVNNFTVTANSIPYQCISNPQPNTPLQWLNDNVPSIFAYGLVILFGVLLYRHSSKQQRKLNQS